MRRSPYDFNKELSEVVEKREELDDELQPFIKKCNDAQWELGRKRDRNNEIVRERYRCLGERILEKLIDPVCKKHGLEYFKGSFHGFFFKPRKGWIVTSHAGSQGIDCGFRFIQPEDLKEGRLRNALMPLIGLLSTDISDAFDNNKGALPHLLGWYVF